MIDIHSLSYMKTASYRNIFSYGAVFKVHTDKSSPGYIGNLFHGGLFSGFTKKYLILAPDGYIYCININWGSSSISPSEKYEIYLARTRAKEKLTEGDIKPYLSPCGQIIGSFSRRYRSLATRDRHIVQLQKVDMSNKPFWLEEWDLAELFS